MKTYSSSPGGLGMRHPDPLAIERWIADHGSMELSPGVDLIAGEPTVLRFTFTCGRIPLPVGAQIGIAWRLPCDWSVPQWERCSASDYVEAAAPEGASLHLAFDPAGGVKPWNHQFTATIGGRTLNPGDQVTFTFGEASGGSIGWHCQTSMAESTSFIGMVRSRPNEVWHRLQDMQQRRVLSGPPASLDLVCPSSCLVGTPFRMTVRMRDRWGNPSRGYAGLVAFENEDLEVIAMERLERWGEAMDVWSVTGRLDRPGRYRLHVIAAAMGLSAKGNPIDSRHEADELELYWGDLHAGQSAIGCGQGSIDDFFWYARNVAALNFVSHQANDVYVTRGEWEETRAVTEAYNAPGSFVTYLGCEWTAQPSAGGDRNVFYRDDESELARAGRWFSESQPDYWPDVPTPNDLYRQLQDKEVLINLHAGGYTSNLDFSDPTTERLVEVHSTHGTSDWLVKEALMRGRKIGISAGTDGIVGRPGASGPGRRQTRNTENGCLGVYAAGNTRKDIWKGLWSRRCIATNGERIRLVVRVGEHWHGEEVTGSEPVTLRIEVAGTAPVERVIVRRGNEVVREEELWRPDPQHTQRYRVVWAGTKKRGTSRDQVMDWRGQLSVDDGTVKLTGPVGRLSNVDQVVQDAENIVRWQSSTAGNVTGFEFEASPGSILQFRSRPIDFEVPVTETMNVLREVPSSEGIGYVRITRAPDQNGSCDAVVDFTDMTAPSGEHPYWVEVVQINGGRAWSSPIYHKLE